MEAARTGDVSRLRGLLAGGAAVDEQDEHGWTALSWAAGRGDGECVAALLAHGADVFHRGRDARTPYMIALAAGRRAAAQLLREGEKQVDPARRGLYPERPYCRAYPLAELRRFAGWEEPPPEASAEPAGEDEGEAVVEDDVAFLHDDLTVTRSAWHGEHVLFASSGEAWREFCATTLGFAVPDDLDLIPVGEQGE